MLLSSVLFPTCETPNPFTEAIQVLPSFLPSTCLSWSPPEGGQDGPVKGKAPWGAPAQAPARGGRAAGDPALLLPPPPATATLPARAAPRENEGCEELPEGRALLKPRLRRSSSACRPSSCGRGSGTAHRARLRLTKGEPEGARLGDVALGPGRWRSGRGGTLSFLLCARASPTPKPAAGSRGSGTPQDDEAGGEAGRLCVVGSVCVQPRTMGSYPLHVGTCTYLPVTRW